MQRSGDYPSNYSHSAPTFERFQCIRRNVQQLEQLPLDFVRFGQPPGARRGIHARSPWRSKELFRIAKNARRRYFVTINSRRGVRNVSN
jgi:hypothetical protein